METLNVFNVDPKDFTVDIGSTKITDVGNGLDVGFAQITHKGKNDFIMMSPPTRTPFGIDGDQQKENKYSLVQALESKNPKHQLMIKTFIEKVHAIDAHLISEMSKFSSDEKWWGQEVPIATLTDRCTPSVKPAGVSKKNKRPFGPSMKYAVHIDHKTNEPKFRAYVKAESGQFNEVFDDILGSVPRNSIVQVAFGFPMAWKSSDKSWGIRWKLVIVWRHGISSSGFRLPQHQIAPQSYNMDIDVEKDFVDDNDAMDQDEVY